MLENLFTVGTQVLILFAMIAIGFTLSKTKMVSEQGVSGMTNTLLEYFAPHADAFIVFAEGNKDEFFTKAAGDKPLILLPKTMDIVKTLTAVNTGS